VRTIVLSVRTIVRTFPPVLHDKQGARSVPSTDRAPYAALVLSCSFATFGYCPVVP
jgi:hypothetical protein